MRSGVLLVPLSPCSATGGRLAVALVAGLLTGLCLRRLRPYHWRHPRVMAMMSTVVQEAHQGSDGSDSLDEGVRRSVCLGAAIQR